jgi:membrane-bound serine protease (ClpP class)
MFLTRHAGVLEFGVFRGARTATVVVERLMRERRTLFWAGLLASCAWTAALPQAACGQSSPPAVMLSVPLPITGTRDTQVEAAILRHLDSLRADPAGRGVLVLRFDTADDDSRVGSDFGRSLGLARFLSDDRLAGVKTVAFLPEGVDGHAVLVALACEEIVMPADMVLGPANTREPLVDDAMRAAYREIASRRKTAPPAVALALVDPAARVFRVSTDDGEQFVEAAEMPAVRERAAVLDTEEMGPVPLALSGRRGRELGIVRRLADTPEEVAQALGLEGTALDSGAAGGWKPAVVAMNGPVTADAVARTRARISQAISAGATLVCLRIDSPGGAAEQSLVLATWLADLDPARVRTVAYVPREARADAALVALACQDLVMHPEAVLGGEGAAAIDERQADAIAVAWREGVARKRGRPWSLPVALAVPGIVVERATQPATGRVEYFSGEELAARDDREAWQVGGRVGSGPIELSGRAAEPLGLVTHLVDDFGGLRTTYGLVGDVPLAEPRWSDRLLDALASPSLAWLLLLIGGAGLYIELHTPGLGFGGFVAMVAFIIYFWSQHLNGTAGWLEVMLFLAGAVCIAAEVLVLPGFGVLGLGGGLLVVASLVLASQSFVVPANDYQIRQLQWSLAGLLGAAVGVAAVAAVARRWLPSAPVFRHVLLPPPSLDDVAGDTDPLDELLGVEGTTTTRLAPAGKARLAGAIRDVTADGGLIEPGTPVRVVEVRGRHVMVRSLASWSDRIRKPS